MIQGHQNRPKTRRIREALRTAVCKIVEPLEPRVLLSGNFLYINDNWHIVTDTGAAGLSAGDTVDNSSDDGSLHGLIFGTNAFNTTSAALAAATSGSTIVFVSGSYAAAFGATINSGISLQGWPSFAKTYALPAANPDASHLTQSALNPALATTLAGAQFTLADPAADAVSISGFKFTGYTATGAIVFATTNHAIATISANTFTSSSTATALIVNAGTALVTANTFSGNGTGVLIHAGNATVSGNHITLATNGYGVVAAGGNALAITGNTFDKLSGLGLAAINVTDNGSLFTGTNGSINAIVSGNIISGSSIAIGLDGQGTGAARATISGNTLTNDSTAIFLQGSSASATVLANVITAATTAVDVQGAAAIVNGNTISNSTTAVLYESAISGAPSSGTLTNNNFQFGTHNATDLDIANAPTLVFGGGDHFGADSFFINNEAPDSYTLTHEDFGTRDPAVVAAKIVDQVDDPTLGKINYNLQLTIDSFLPNATLIHAGDTLTVQGAYTDGLAQDPHQIHIDWGDGTAPQTLPVSGGTFSLTHPYSTAGTDSISAFLIAADGATTSLSSTAISILNVPVLTATFNPIVINDGGTVTLSGNVSEPGSHTYTLNVNWGSSVQGVFLGATAYDIAGIIWDPATGDFILPHHYSGVIPGGATAAVFSVTASITDSDNTLGNTLSNTVDIFGGPPRNVAIGLASAVPAAISSNATAASVFEATALTLNGSFSDPGADSPDTFNWHVTDNNGQVIADATTQSFAFTPVQNGTGGTNATYSTIFTVTDATTGSTASTPFVFTVVDKPPVIDLSTSATTSTIGATYTLDLGKITDPGTLDVITGYKINWGDGTTSDHTGAGLPPATQTHTYTAASSNYTINVTLIDNDGSHSGAGTLHLSVASVGGTGTVVGRHIFYKGSAFDAGGHDNAIATDKTALLPGQTAGSANYSSYSLGINGIMVDISGSPSGITASDFSFAVGNDNAPQLWAALAATATITVRPGAGAGGSTRVEITFNNSAVSDEWLQVTVQADAHTGLAVPDVFYFGNAIAEAGDSPTDAKVNATDEISARSAATATATITNPFDYNRDGKVDATDVTLARSNYTYFVNELHLIQLGGGSGPSLLAASPTGPASLPPVPAPIPVVPPPAPAVSSTTTLSSASPAGIVPNAWSTLDDLTKSADDKKPATHVFKSIILKLIQPLRIHRRQT